MLIIMYTNTQVASGIIHLHTSHWVFASPWPLLYILTLPTVTSSPCGSSWTAWGCALIGTGWVGRNLTRVCSSIGEEPQCFQYSLLTLPRFHHPNYWLWSSKLMLPWCFLRHMFVKVTGYHVNRQLVFPVLTEIMSHSSKADTSLYLAHRGRMFILVIFMPALCPDCIDLRYCFHVWNNYKKDQTLLLIWSTLLHAHK